MNERINEMMIIFPQFYELVESVNQIVPNNSKINFTKINHRNDI